MSRDGTVSWCSLPHRPFVLIEQHTKQSSPFVDANRPHLRVKDSRMSADWSAIRRRQTLGEVLSNTHGASQIPQPSSVFKKSAAGRASVAPGGLAGLGPAPPPRSSLAPARFFRSSSGGNLASEAALGGSLGSSQASSQRESLRNSRQSYAPQQSIKYHSPTPTSTLLWSFVLLEMVLTLVVDGAVRIRMDDLRVSGSYLKYPRKSQRTQDL